MSKSTINRIIAVAVLLIVSAVAMVLAKSRVTVSPPTYPSDSETAEKYNPVITTQIPDDTESTDTTGSDTENIPDDAENDFVLKETSPASIDYLDRLVFIGDRTIGKMTEFAITELPHLTQQVWSCQENTSVAKAINTESFLYPVNNEYVSFATAIKNYMPSYVVLTFGSYTENTDAEYTKEAFLTAYGEFITNLKSASPNTQFIIQSILPVGKGCGIITPEQVKERNSWLKEFCKQNNIYYLDSFSVLSDPDGFLYIEFYDPDNIVENTPGYTMNDVGYRKMIEYLRTHVHPSYAPNADQ